MAKRKICKIVGCGKIVRTCNLCDMHYSRLRRHGSPLIQGRVAGGTLIAWIKQHSLYSKKSCLIWPFGLKGNNTGYPGCIYTPDGRRMLAARFMCELVNGKPPTKKYHAAHSCGKGHLGCINPKHLYWATPLKNRQDTVDHGTIALGEKHGLSKLTEKDVVKIRSLQGKMTQQEIAKMFGVSSSSISNIYRQITWGWL
jgi:hypothetical protein